MMGPVANGQFFTHFSLFTSRGTGGHNSNGNSIYANPPPHSTFRGVQMVCAEFGMVRLSDRSRQLIHCCTEGLFRLWAQGLLMILKLRFRRDFEAEVWSVFCRWGFVEVMKLNLGRDSEARFGHILNLKFSRDADVWLRFWSWYLVEILKMKFD